jgi:hypothetical protein
MPSRFWTSHSFKDHAFSRRFSGGCSYIRTAILPINYHFRTIHFWATGCATAQSENLLGNVIVIQFKITELVGTVFVEVVCGWSKNSLTTHLIRTRASQDFNWIQAIKRRFSEQVKI